VALAFNGRRDAPDLPLSQYTEGNRTAVSGLARGNFAVLGRRRFPLRL